MALAPFQPNSTSPSATWLFHSGMRVITHGANECGVCNTWIAHFALASARRRSDLAEAERERDAAIMGRLPGDCADLCRALDGAHDALDGLRHDGDALRDEVANLRGELGRADHTIARLRDHIASLDRDRSPRPRKLARRRSPSTSPSRASSRGSSPRTSSRSVSPMREDPVDRLASPPTPRRAPPTPRYSAQPSETPTSSSQTLVPPPSGALLSRMTDGSPAAPVTTVPPVLDAAPPPLLSAGSTPFPFWPAVGFSSRLPVYFQGEDKRLLAADRSAPVDASGAFVFEDEVRYIFAFGRFINGQPSWRTSLVRGSFFTCPAALGARQDGTALPISGMVSGGRNSMLISDSDPTTDADIESLLATPERGGYAIAFIDRIRFTPPELRNDIHNHALERWRTLCREHQAAKNAHRPQRAEPSPRAEPAIWRSWLKAMEEDAHKKGRTFSYLGIPRVGNGYQSAHIEGTKAILACVPLTNLS
ncbi:hypothetical protein BC826DRAFT_1111937 [Russula brevipes]|nr:hypothetical protein BC826DRAFT_1111937 [Russula brevipes]